MKALLRSSLLCAAAALPPAAQAQGTSATSDWRVSGNIGLFSDYRFRGMTQTDYGPALQGGFDIGHSSGLYIGNWNSNVEQKLYNGASLEMDFYGGFKGAVGDFSYDLGGWVLGLAYIGNSEKEFAFTGNSFYEAAAGLRTVPEGAGKASVVVRVSKSC